MMILHRPIVEVHMYRYTATVLRSFVTEVFSLKLSHSLKLLFSLQTDSIFAPSAPYLTSVIGSSVK
jgi:hypothetical protein